MNDGVGSALGVGSVDCVGAGELEPSAGAVLLGGAATVGAAAVSVGVGDLPASEVAGLGDGVAWSPAGVGWAERLGFTLWCTSALVAFVWWGPGHARAAPVAAATQATRPTTGRTRRLRNGFLCLACVPRTSRGCSLVYAFEPSAAPAPTDSRPTAPKPAGAGSRNMDSPGLD